LKERVSSTVYQVAHECSLVDATVISGAQRPLQQIRISGEASRVLKTSFSIKLQSKMNLPRMNSHIVEQAGWQHEQ